MAWAGTKLVVWGSVIGFGFGLVVQAPLSEFRLG